MNCRLVLSLHSHLCDCRRFLSSQAKLRSTTQRLGMTLKVCGSRHLAICAMTCSPRISLTPSAKAIQPCCVCVLHTLRVHDQVRAAVLRPCLLRAARPLKQAVVVARFTPDGEVRVHRAPLREVAEQGTPLATDTNRYSTAQNTSYRATFQGMVPLRALSSGGRIRSN